VVLATAASAAAPASWQKTLDRATKGVVVLRLSVPRAFDTQSPAVETATGFVVDAERGLILTNRHVVKPGPVIAEAVFLDDEEVAVSPVYRDPVHDFGFYRYDPADVKFMEPVEIPLEPDHARVGAEIRVVGNDAGEKLSILAGTLARLDRRAPQYGRSRFNDFNTFYIQAASSTSGGSSGSPVLDIHGHAVALNAGGSRRASSSFYLPIEPIARALAKIQAGEPVPRGTLQTVFLHQSFDELRRLGLQPQTEADLRREFPDATGLLAVREVLPQGPADGALEVGDILVRADGVPIASFAPLGRLLDASVGEHVRLEVERGGKPLSVEMEVGDLHAITPAEYLEIGGGVIHPLSYQQARNFGAPLGGLYLAATGYMFSRAEIPWKAVITALDGKPVTSLEAFEAQLAALPDGSRVSLRYFDLEHPQSQTMTVVTVDRRWFPMQRCVRDDASGRWPCTASPAPAPLDEIVSASTTFSDHGPKAARNLAPSLVMVNFSIPFRIDGVHGERFIGTGLVVDADKGLVVVDRETVPIALGDARITFAASIEVPADVLYIHPEHGVAVLAYDPALVGETPVESARFESMPLRSGDEVWVVGLDQTHDVVWRETRVSLVESPSLPLPTPPRFRESNVELIGIEDDPGTLGGVLSDSAGRVLALWGSIGVDGEESDESFFAGTPGDLVQRLVAPLREGKPVEWRSLGAELRATSLVKARNRGLPDSWAESLADRPPRDRRFLSVLRLTAETSAAELLEEGDLILSLDGQVAPTFDEVEQAAQSPKVAVVVLRAGEEVALELETTPLDGGGTEHFALFAGAVLQEPHRAIVVQKGIASQGVYVAWLWYGSPANRYQMRATRRILAVDGLLVPDLDAFLAAVRNREDRSVVRLHMLDLEGTPEVVTLKLDLEYWPTREFRRGADGWHVVGE
jgi:S1-C subfamily serine protease